MKYCILIFSFLAIFESRAQVDSTGRVRLNLFIASGSSHFKSSPSGPSKFSSLELRTGITIKYALGNSWNIVTRPALGIKFKREAFNKYGQGYIIGPPFLTLDEVASNRNHYFFDELSFFPAK
jgi:hypothetical protein